MHRTVPASRIHWYGRDVVDTGGSSVKGGAAGGTVGDRRARLLDAAVPAVPRSSGAPRASPAA
ncbi:hypothetical protein GCM10010358_13450 [Streptomyces minutiscleroticus]|uniref:Uncharacterized protein n=1 Tax=Streptomyces minutiscleroticus TaxID=68238 RepID=A0A918KE11_9ACTN|nr:hypothetical protein GCM10010358_13450 [Streptomyces minutiscleroticus]